MSESEVWLEKLFSSSKVDRLQAARYFSDHARDSHLPSLLKAFAQESVPWIKRSLEKGIATSRDLSPKPIANRSVAIEPVDDVTESVRRGIHLKAVEEVAGTILHEFSAVIGSLRLRAPEEVQAYDASRTKNLLDQLSDLMDAVRNLKRSAAVPFYTEVDLHELVDKTLANLDIPTEVVVSTAGPKPFFVRADRNSMQLALVNGFRNAIEAIGEFSRSTPPRLVVNWGRAGIETWLVVVDSGQGFTGDPSSVLGLGVTNKPAHIGFGLATAQYAMRSMGGDIFLSNDAEGGARFEIRWSTSDENSVS